MVEEFKFSGSNFVAGKWENGFGIKFLADEENVFRAKYRFSEHQQGPPTIAHGGAIAAILDEAMTAAAFHAAKEPAFTVNLNLNYRAAIFLGVEVEIVAKVEEMTERKISLSAHISLPDGTITTEATAIFVRLSGVG